MLPFQSRLLQLLVRNLSDLSLQLHSLFSARVSARLDRANFAFEFRGLHTKIAHERIDAFQALLHHRRFNRVVLATEPSNLFLFRNYLRMQRAFT